MRFLFRAQDNNMTNGDFAFFSYASGLTSRTYQPWDRYVDDPSELPYRRRAYYGLKQVSLMPVETLIRLLVVCSTRYATSTVSVLASKSKLVYSSFIFPQSSQWHSNSFPPSSQLHGHSSPPSLLTHQPPTFFNVCSGLWPSSVRGLATP